MKLIIDENIAFAEETFSQFGEVILSHGRKITNAILKDADALVVRSITKVNRELLEGTKVIFVGTATIGTDHIDKEYLKANNITFADAKGCNADAVTEYIFTAIFRLLKKNNRNIDGLKLGIVGCGNIGGRISRIAPQLGFTVLKNDPPLERAGIGGGYVPLSEILKADIITIHTPLNRGGIDNTFHLFDQAVFDQIKNTMIFCNASRGEVVETNAILDAVREKRFESVLDVWENEPVIAAELLDLVTFASPHIAGYSYEGKVNGTVMMYNALCRHLGKEPDLHLQLEPVKNNHIAIDSTLPSVEMFDRIMQSIYSIEDDTMILKQAGLMDDAERGKYFDKLRKDYKLRREFTNFTIRLEPYDEATAAMLKSLRFKVL